MAGPASPGQALLVLGMSRTGTSTATCLLSLLGLHLGGDERLMAPDARVNARGYFEHYEIMRLNTAILRAFGGSWKAPPALEPGWEEDPRLDPLRRQAAEILARDFAGASLWGFKDPRTSLTLPFWRPFLGPAPRFVLCHRNPLDVAASLQARDGIEIEAGLDLWRRTAAAAVAATDGAQRVVVRYDEFFADRDRVMASLAAFAGRPEAASDRSVRDRFDAWLTDELRHHRHGTAELLEHPAVSPGVRELHLVHDLAAGARAHPETWDRALSVAAGAPSALAERVRSLAPWRYAIDLGAGVRTSPERPELVNRHRQRRRHVLEPLKAALGGSLDAMRVLDLWCGAGYFSLAAIEAGCAHVLGLDGRPAHVEQARLVFEARRVDPGRHEFRHANVLKVAPESLGTFDVVLALGLGHRDDAIAQVLERVATWTRRVAVLDLRLAGPHSPTVPAVVAEAEGLGFGVQILEPAFDDWTGAADYRRGARATLLLTYR